MSKYNLSDTLLLTQWFIPEEKKQLSFDRGFIILAITLYSLGLIMVASSSMPVAERLFGNSFHFVIRHAIYICLSLMVAG